MAMALYKGRKRKREGREREDRVEDRGPEEDRERRRMLEDEAAGCPGRRNRKEVGEQWKTRGRMGERLGHDL
ncbi:hypothetical protein ACLOJK_006181 [Asimina triloba]